VSDQFFLVKTKFQTDPLIHDMHSRYAKMFKKTFEQNSENSFIEISSN
jgi:hypothetical protein